MKGEKEYLKRQMDDCLDYIEALRKGFDEASDNELVSYYIYETKAAEAKYRYLSGLYSGMTLK